MSSLAACGSAGPWGHARHYVPDKGEDAATTGARELDAPMAQLNADAWRGQRVRFFMVVTARRPAPGGGAYLTGRIATRNEINACASKHDDDSCRVTIKPKAHEMIHAVVQLMPRDDAGDLRVGSDSLLRIVGTIADQPDPDDGKLVIRGTWYRQWPLGYYVKEGDLRQ